MATALAKGLIHYNVCPSVDIFAADINPDQLDAFGRSTAAHVCETNAEVVSECDAAILAVKPNQVADVLVSIFEAFAKATPLLISIAAGVPLAKLEAGLPSGAPRDMLMTCAP